MQLKLLSINSTKSCLKNDEKRRVSRQQSIDRYAGVVFLKWTLPPTQVTWQHAVRSSEARHELLVWAKFV